jgi:uncharacterized protein YcnI
MNPPIPGKHVHRFIARLVLITMVFTGGTMAFASVAGAHTDTEAVPADAGRTRITLTPEQECGGGSLPTSGLRLQLPAGSGDVQPLPGTGGTAEVTATEVRWSSPDPGTGSTTFVVEMVLAQPAGSTLYLPTIQLCPDGEEIPWIQIPTVAGERLPGPAPSIVVPVNATAPTTAPTTSTTAATSTTTENPEGSAPAVIAEDDSTDGGGTFLWVALAAGVAAIVGAAALVYLRRRART